MRLCSRNRRIYWCIRLWCSFFPGCLVWPTRCLMGIVYGFIVASRSMRFATRTRRFVGTTLYLWTLVSSRTVCQACSVRTNLSPTAEGTGLGCSFAWTARLSCITARISCAHCNDYPNKADLRVLVGKSQKQERMLAANGEETRKEELPRVSNHRPRSRGNTSIAIRQP
jgi:hypothetical protein